MNGGTRPPNEGEIRSDKVTGAMGVRSDVTDLTLSDRSDEARQNSGDRVMFKQTF